MFLSKLEMMLTKLLATKKARILFVWGLAGLITQPLWMLPEAYHNLAIIAFLYDFAFIFYGWVFGSLAVWNWIDRGAR